MTHTPIAYLLETLPDEKELPQRFRAACQRINQLIRGRNNVHGTLTLTASVATTVVLTQLAHSERILLLEPTTANAAAELGAGTCYRSATSAGVSFTLKHANNAQTDRTFNYMILG